MENPERNSFDEPDSDSGTGDQRVGWDAIANRINALQSLVEAQDELNSRIESMMRPMIASIEASGRLVGQKLLKDLAGLEKFVVKIPTPLFKSQISWNQPVSPELKLNSILKQQVEQIARTLGKFKSELGLVISDKLRENLSEYLKQLERQRPRNWPTGETIRWSEMSTFFQDTRWPIVWVPRVDIVEQLIAPNVDRDEVLRNSSTKILDDCAKALDEIVGTNITSLVPFAKEAIDAARAGAWSPCQAMSAAILTTILHRQMGFKRLSEARAELNFNPDEALTGFIRYAFIVTCIPWSLLSFDAVNGDPIPTDFNRHASVHEVSNEQYTHRNGLIALIMTVALLREIHEQQANGSWSQVVRESDFDERIN